MNKLYKIPVSDIHYDCNMIVLAGSKEEALQKAYEYQLKQSRACVEILSSIAVYETETEKDVWIQEHIQEHLDNLEVNKIQELTEDIYLSKEERALK